MTRTSLTLSHLDQFLDRNKEIVKECQKFVRGKDPGVALSAEDLHLASAPNLMALQEELKTRVSEAYGVGCQTQRMWAVFNQGPSKDSNIAWHNHQSDVSGVYYVELRGDFVYPEGAFGILTPEPVFIMPKEGLFITFSHDLYHDAIPIKSTNSSRLSIAIDFDFVS